MRSVPTAMTLTATALTAMTALTAIALTAIALTAIALTALTAIALTAIALTAIALTAIALTAIALTAIALTALTAIALTAIALTALTALIALALTALALALALALTLALTATGIRESADWPTQRDHQAGGGAGHDQPTPQSRLAIPTWPKKPHEYNLKPVPGCRQGWFGSVRLGSSDSIRHKTKDPLLAYGRTNGPIGRVAGRGQGPWAGRPYHNLGPLGVGRRLEPYRQPKGRTGSHRSR